MRAALVIVERNDPFMVMVEWKSVVLQARY